MARFKKRSVAPIYAIALVWVIFTLVHPLYRVSDYVSVILLSALAFVVAKGIRPTVEYELPAPEPQEEPSEEIREDEPSEETVPQEDLADQDPEPNQAAPQDQEEAPAPSEDLPSPEEPDPSEPEE